MKKLPNPEHLLYKQNLAFRKRFREFIPATAGMQLYRLTLTVPYSTRPDFYVKDALLYSFQMNLTKSHGVTHFIWTASKVNGIARFQMVVAGTEEPNERWEYLWERKIRDAYGHEWAYEKIQVYQVAPVTEPLNVTEFLITANRMEKKNWGSTRNLLKQEGAA